MEFGWNEKGTNIKRENSFAWPMWVVSVLISFESVDNSKERYMYIRYGIVIKRFWSFSSPFDISPSLCFWFWFCAERCISSSPSNDDDQSLTICTANMNEQARPLRFFHKNAACGHFLGKSAAERTAAKDTKFLVLFKESIRVHLLMLLSLDESWKRSLISCRKSNGIKLECIEF